MSNSSANGRRAINAENRRKSSRIEVLMRQLVAVVGGSGGSGAPLEGEETLFDLEVDGLRYALIISKPPRAAADVSLTPREVEIACLVAKGYVNKTIAGLLDISCYTVDTYMRRIFAKLTVTSRAAMVARLSEDGLFKGRISERST
jgi:DNA-binding NarL/FixJ family response regulator